MKTTIRIFRINLIRVIVFVFCLFLIPVTNAQLSGTYTIDPSGGGLPNFISFDAAVSTLISQGISGPVIINVAPGTYTVHTVIPQITGVSATNTITIQSSSTDSTLVTLFYTYTNSSTENYMFMLDGADYITFKCMTFNAYDGEGYYGTVFYLTGGANNNKFLNNAFYGKSGYNPYGNLIYSSGTLDENNVFGKNLFSFGHAAIVLSGVNSTTLSAGTLIDNNVFKEQTQSSIILKFQNAPLIEGNIIEISSGTDGIYLEEVDRKFQIIDNDIKINQATGAININNCNGLIGMNGLIANNMLKVITSSYETENCAGIRIYNSSYLQVYYNSSLIISGMNNISSSLYVAGSGSNIDIRNNNLANFAYGYAYNVIDAVNISDYNNYYTNGNYLGKWESVGREDLEALRAATSGDAHSVSVNPAFYSDEDLHTTTFRLENKGTNLASVVSFDFDGEPRSVSPDIGADEFITGTGSALSGEYFIGGSSPDYTTLTQAVEQLNKYGILSSVIFNIRDDNSPYSEQIKILPVTGADALNTITFQPDPANTEDAIITFNSEDYNANYTLEMNRTSYVIIKDLLLMSENSTYGTVIKLNGLCYHDTISGCTIICPSQGGNNHGIYSYGGQLKNIFITSNRFNSGQTGINLDGASNRGIRQDIEISENYFNENSNGISISYCSNNLKILKNKVNSIYQGIEVSNFSGALINKGLIANNYINLKENGYNAIGLYLSNVSYLQVNFNTVKIGKQNSYDNSKVFLIETNSNTDVRNNIFCNFGVGYAYYKSGSGSVAQSDYNALFTAGKYIAQYDGNRKGLSDLQIISGKDIHSVDDNPAFISEDEVHINSPFIDGSGITISGLISDIDGETRSNPPDIGADEYTSSVIPIPGGIYKIGGTVPDYNTIKQAFDDLQVRGVSGPVIFEIREGEYNEFIGPVYEISGCTKSDSVVVRSESGNPEDVVIYYNSTIPDNENIIHFKGTDYFTFAGLTISTSGDYNGSQVKITGSANNINIINNELISSITYQTLISIDALIDQLLVRDNLISGSGISFDGYSETTNARIIGNIISGSVGIIFNSSSSGTDTWIIGNKISGTSTAIQLYNQIKSKIIGNTILASSGVGIILQNCVNNLPFYGVIANNMIYVGGSYYAYGINFNYNNKRIYIYNNTINITNYDYWDSYGIYINDYASNLAEIKVLNNIISNSSGHWTLYTVDANDITESDYNDFYTTGSDFVKWGETACTDLTALRSANGMDAHSLSLDPKFYSDMDLHSAQAAFHKAGTPLDDVPYDIDSIPRDPIKPDIGAVEFTCGPPVFNVLVSPTCLGDTTTFLDKSTNITRGSTYGWDFDGDFIPDEGYISTKSNDTIKYYFNTQGVHAVNFIVSQVGGCNDYTTINVGVKNSPRLEMITEGAYCGVDNGEATAHITEGDGPFKYFWSTGATDTTITGLAQGTYTVAVSDANGCISNEEVTIENKIKVVVKQLEPSTCGISDGGAEVTATGGVKPYSYVWSDGNNTFQNWNLLPGRHYVNVIDANNCYSQGFVDIENDGSGPQVTLDNIVHNKCYGDQHGSIDISVIGDYISLQWSNGETAELIDSLTAGVYDVLITAEDGCLGSGSFEVSQPTQLQISSIVENSTCAGSDGTATAVVSGGLKPYIYHWSTEGIYQIEENLPAGIYSVTVFDANACMAKIPVIVNSVGGPVVIINSVTGASCPDYANGAIDIGISGGMPLYTFEWLPGGQITPDISGLSPDTYEIKVTDQAGCIGVNTVTVEKAAPAVNPICLVTVDTITGKNMIVWEKLNTTNVDHYVIYRESSIENEYQPVGIRPADSLSIFIDPVADPMLRSWRYKLSVVDVCGNESALSDHHKTMHLTMNLGLNNSVNLIWDHYEGFDVNTYEVYRYNSQTAWQNITDMPANLASYTDMSPNMENLIYYVETEYPTGCTATDLKAETLNSTRSNRQRKLKVTGFPDNFIGNLNLVIWPNPGNGIFNLSMENASSENIKLKVYDISGKLVYIKEYNTPDNNFETEIDLSLFADGIYHLHLSIDNTIFHRVLIKE